MIKLTKKFLDSIKTVSLHSNDPSVYKFTEIDFDGYKRQPIELGMKGNKNEIKFGTFPKNCLITHCGLHDHDGKLLFSGPVKHQFADGGVLKGDSFVILPKQMIFYLL